jgi:hypothetical protein
MNAHFWIRREEYLLGMWYGKKPLDEIARRLKRTSIAIRSRATFLHLGIRKFWTSEEKRHLKKYYRNHTAEQCAKKLNRTRSAIYRQVHKSRLHHSKEFADKFQRINGALLAQAGKQYRIKPGGILPNGKRHKTPKGSHYSPETEFKKGQLPAGTLYDGAIRIRHTGTGHRGEKRLMKFIRIKKAKWVYLKNYIWQKHHGKIPRGMMVAFRNPKDTLNCSLRNLCLITKAESIRRTRDTDEYIAMTLSRITGKPRGSGSYDRETFAHVLKHPSLIALKRKQLQFKRKLKEHGKAHRK